MTTFGSEVAARRLRTGEKATRPLGLRHSRSVRARTNRRPGTSHKSTRPSCQPTARRLPSGEKLTDHSAHRPVGERDERAAAGQLPEITPLPSAKVFLAGLRPVPVQQPARFAEVVQLERLLGEIHVRRVEQSPRLLLALGGVLRLCVGALLLGLRLRWARSRPRLAFAAPHGAGFPRRFRHFGCPLCLPGGESLPGAGQDADRQHDDEHGRRREAELVPPNGLLKLDTAALGGRATTGSLFRCRLRSDASPLAVS